MQSLFSVLISFFPAYEGSLIQEREKNDVEGKTLPNSTTLIQRAAMHDNKLTVFFRTRSKPQVTEQAWNCIG